MTHPAARRSSIFSLPRIARLALAAALSLTAVVPITHAAEDSTDSPAERLLQIKQLQREQMMRGARNRFARIRAARFAPPDYRPRPTRDRRLFDTPRTGGSRQRPTPAFDAPGAGPAFGTPEAAGIPGGFRLLSDPNVAVSNPATDLSNEGQSEPSIAAWRQYVVAAWNDGQGFVTGSSRQGFATSADSGATFTDLGTPPAPSSGQWSSDPVVTVNEKTGEFYYCALADISPFRSAVGMVRGTFTGSLLTWDTPRVVSDVSSFAGFLDKCWIVADSSSGFLYVVYTEFVFSPEANYIDLQRSTDQGVTWSARARLSPESASRLVQGGRPAVGPDGRLYVVWKEIGPTDQDFFRVRVSSDGGLLFGAQGTVAAHYDNFGTGAPGFNRERGITFPSIAVDRSVGSRRGRVYVGWNESTNWYDAVSTLGTSGVVAETEGNDTPATADPFTPGQQLSGSFADAGLDHFTFNATQGLTYVFWCDQVPGSAFYHMQILCADGATRLALAGDSEAPTGNQSLIAWTAPSTDTYFLRMVHLSGGTGAYRVRTGVDPPSAGRARDHRDVFVVSSADGVTWGSPVRVNDDPPYFDNWLPEVAVDAAGSVYALWNDWRDAPASTCGGVSHVYLSRSDDGAATWGSLGPTTDTQTAWTSVSSNIIPNQGDYLGLFANDHGVYPCWTDGRRGNPDVMAAPLRFSQTQIAVQAFAADTHRVRITWRATKQGSPASVTVGLYRRFGTTPFDSISTMTSNASGQLTYDDEDITPEVVYQYQLRLPEGAGSRFVGQITVFVPRPQGPALALGSPYPNPTPGNILVPLTLPTGDAATLKLLDIAGREVRTQAVGWRGAGNHIVNLAEGEALRPGLYVIRLTQGGSVVSRRVSVVP